LLRMILRHNCIQSAIVTKRINRTEVGALVIRILFAIAELKH
jgi:hypothetical protein